MFITTRLNLIEFNLFIMTVTHIKYYFNFYDLRERDIIEPC